MSTSVRRVFFLVMDSVGVGELPDAGAFGDEGSDTLGNTAAAVGGLNLPVLGSLGLGNLHPVQGVAPAEAPLASWGVLHEASAGKDTTTGHWELAGQYLPDNFATFPDGFPDEIMKPWLEAIGVESVLGNYAASGTEIIEKLGARHLETGWPIVYTSADSVFQIAAHEERVPLEQLHQWCKAARKLLDPHNVARVISRPFVGPGPGSFERTYNRHDYSMTPPTPTLLTQLEAAGLEVIGVGKIGDIFVGQGVGENIRTKGNADGMAQVQRLVKQWHGRGLVFVNLIDFDMLYGHRRNPQGYAAALEALDRDLGPVVEALGPEDVLLLSADHGCDPTFMKTTDHTREQVPLLVYRPGRPGVDLGARATFADVGQSLAEALGAQPTPFGTSFWGEIAG